MTATLTLPQLLGLACLACLVGFLFGVLAAWRPGDDPVPPLQLERAGLELPRPVRLELEPPWPAIGDTWSENSAAWDRLERNVCEPTHEFPRMLP